MNREMLLVEVTVITVLIVVAGILAISGWAHLNEALATLEALR